LGVVDVGLDGFVDGVGQAQESCVELSMMSVMLLLQMTRLHVARCDACEILSW
jgi:hypothetical protein